MWVLAELRWQGGWWPERTASDVRWLGWVLVVLAALLVGRIVWRYAQRLAVWTRPLRLFAQVASAAGLGAGEKWLLHRIARRQKLTSPLTLLMSPATLEHHAAVYTREMPARHAAAVRGRVEAIMKRMR